MKNIFNRKGGKRSAANKPVMPNSGYQSYYYNIGSPSWSGRNYTKFADEAYIRNVIAHQSIAKIALDSLLSGVTKEMRIRYGERIFSILCILNPYEENILLEITAQEE